MRALGLLERVLQTRVMEAREGTKVSKFLLQAQVLAQMGHSNFEMGPNRYENAVCFMNHSFFYTLIEFILLF